MLNEKKLQCNAQHSMEWQMANESKITQNGFVAHLHRPQTKTENYIAIDSNCVCVCVLREPSENSYQIEYKLKSNVMTIAMYATAR